MVNYNYWGSFGLLFPFFACNRKSVNTPQNVWKQVLIAPESYALPVADKTRTCLFVLMSCSFREKDGRARGAKSSMREATLQQLWRAKLCWPRCLIAFGPRLHVGDCTAAETWHEWGSSIFYFCLQYIAHPMAIYGNSSFLRFPMQQNSWSACLRWFCCCLFTPMPSVTNNVETQRKKAGWKNLLVMFIFSNIYIYTL